MAESSRKTPFPARVRTRVWQELPDPDNAFLARAARVHGYAHEDLIRAADPAATLYLLLRGELPSAAQRTLLDRFLVAFCNPGPRHESTRAIMNAAASGTRSAALAPIGLALLGGEHLGAAEVEASARFLAARGNSDPEALARELCTDLAPGAPGTDRRIAPGFGALAGAIDPFARTLATALLERAAPDGPLAWAARFAAALATAQSGWLQPGVAAAACLELGLPPRAAGLVYQFASLPGLIAHALEVAGKGPAAMPFVPDERYELLDAEDLA